MQTRFQTQPNTAARNSTELLAYLSRNYCTDEQPRNIKLQDAYRKDIVSEFLLSHGIYPHLRGYRYLRVALLRGLADPYFFDNVTHVCYPELAREFHATEQSVERAIRHALLRAEERAVSETARQWGHCTNREFLVRATEHIRLLMQ